MLITQKYYPGFKILTFLFPAIFVSGMAYSAISNNFPELLIELNDVVMRFVEVDARGQQIQGVCDNNRQEVRRLDSEASAIAGLKA